MAQQSWTFTQAYAQSSSTRISFPSFLSARIPGHIHWKKRGRYYQMTSELTMVQELFQTAGYRTVFANTRWFEKYLPSLARGFDDVLDAWHEREYTEARNGSAPTTTLLTTQFLASLQPQERFFAVVYYEGPHAPYHPLKRFGISAGEGKAKDLYNGEIELVDRNLGFLLDTLRANERIWQDTVVVVTADHGEEFKEHGGKHHSRTCFAESTHVPLIVRIPGQPRKTISSRVSLVDIVPTLLELNGLEAPEHCDGLSLISAALGDSTADGQSEASPAASGGPAEGKARPVYCSYFSGKNPHRRMLRTVRRGDWSLHKYYQSKRFKLYNTAQDPKEQRDLSEEARYKETLHALEKQLGQTHRFKFSK